MESEFTAFHDKIMDIMAEPTILQKRCEFYRVHQNEG